MGVLYLQHFLSFSGKIRDTKDLTKFVFPSLYHAPCVFSRKWINDKKNATMYDLPDALYFPSIVEFRILNSYRTIYYYYFFFRWNPFSHLFRHLFFFPFPSFHKEYLGNYLFTKWTTCASNAECADGFVRRAFNKNQHGEFEPFCFL